MSENKCGVFAPSYYKEFKCIADRCRHSCCTDWEICIDGETCAKYEQMPDILATVTEFDGEKAFSLREDGRCVHLNESGLCNIILNHGEGCLPEICRNHPRFFNALSGRVEAGLGIVCEEACRLVLENDIPLSLYRIDGCRGEPEQLSFGLGSRRDEIMYLIYTSKSYIEALINFEFRFLFQIKPEEWLERFLTLETLDERWKQNLKAAVGKPRCACDGFDIYYKRLLGYFVYRHVSAADSERNLRARLAFSVLSVEIIRLLFEVNAEPTLERLADFARRYSAEIEYSEDNTAELIFAFEIKMMKGKGQ